MKIWIILFIGSFCLNSYGQNFLFQDQNNFRPYLTNPAMAGSDKTGSIGILYRKQLLGFQNSPSSQAISFDFPFTKRKIGFGFNGFKDNNGFFSFTGVESTFSYHLVTQYKKGIPNTGISFGLSATFNQYHFDSNDWKALETDDLTISDLNKLSESYPNANIGFNFHSHGFYFGVSAYNLISRYSDIFINEDDLQNSFQLFLSSGFEVNIKDKFILRPKLLFRTQGNADYQLDVSADFELLATEKSSFKVTPFFRTFGYAILNGRQSFGSSIQVSRNPIKVGYQIDIPFSKINNQMFGNHAFFLALDINSNNKKKAESSNRKSQNK
jgi:type IX secretion system PorP/SprF family membrane protein